MEKIWSTFTVNYFLSNLFHIRIYYHMGEYPDLLPQKWVTRLPSAIHLPLHKQYRSTRNGPRKRTGIHFYVFFYSNIFLFSPLVNVWIITVKVWYHFNNFVSFYIYIFLSDLSSPLPFALLSYILSFSFFGLSVLFHKKEVGISQVPATFHPNRYLHWCCRW